MLFEKQAYAVFLYDQGRYLESEMEHLIVIRKRIQFLGKSRPETLASMYSLAVLYYRVGRVRESRNLMLSGHRTLSAAQFGS